MFGLICLTQSSATVTTVTPSLTSTRPTLTPTTLREVPTWTPNTSSHPVYVPEEASVVSAFHHSAPVPKDERSNPSPLPPSTNWSKTISFSTNQFLHCSLPPVWPVTGPTHVVSGTTTPRTSWSGSTRKIISVLSPWNWEATSTLSSRDSVTVSTKSRST